MDRSSTKRRISRTRRERLERMNDFYTEMLQQMPQFEEAKPPQFVPPLLNDLTGNKETMH